MKSKCVTEVQLANAVGCGVSDSDAGQVLSKLITERGFQPAYDFVAAPSSVVICKESPEQRTLSSLAEAGVVETTAQTPSTCSWRICSHAWPDLKVVLELKTQKRLLRPRPNVEFADMTVMELFLTLEDQGFTVQVVSKRVTRTSIPPWNARTGAQSCGVWGLHRQHACCIF